MGKADRISFPSSAKAAAPAPLPATPAESDAEGLNYRVWYGTHRKPILQGKKVIGYSAERDKTTHLGRCIVKVPKSHKFGEEGSTGVWASIKRFVGGEDDRLALTQLDALDSDQFWKGIADQVASAGVEDRDAVVFIHGYKNTFEDAAIRAAQIGADLKIKGAMAFYSWPSRGTAFGYAPDEATIGPSAKFITGFLTKIARKSKAKRVHVIVHSMGNRATLQAVKDIVQTAGKKTGVIFNQFILAAPDVDADEFEDVARHYNAVAARTTLYVSDRDKAVGLSKTAHDYHRVGYAPPFQVVKGIDTVYAGNVDESFMGHSYVASAEWLLNDMHQLIHQDAEPVKRARMRRDDTDQYWILGDKR